MAKVRSTSHSRDADSSTDKDHLTQFCPRCGYDLYGLPLDRCPECGSRFDRGQLPVVRWPEPQANLPANLVLVGALFLALTECYRLRPGALDTAIQLASLCVMWVFTALWLWLRREDVFKKRRQHWLLWLLLPCGATAGKIAGPAPLPLALGICSGLTAVVILGYVLRVATRKAISVLLFAFSGCSAIGGALLMIGGTACFIGGVDSGGSYYLFGHETRATGVNHLYAAAYGAGLLCIGLLTLMLARRVSKGNRSAVREPT